MRAIVLVLDSVGIGQAPDADAYGDIGAYTLQNTASSIGGLALPVFQSMGLGCIPPLLSNGRPIEGVAAVNSPTCGFGAMQEVSTGKDTITGHWEIAGLHTKEGFHIFPPENPSFPVTLITQFEYTTERRCIGNKAASGTVIIEELGEQQMRDGSWIVYTSADSVFQIAAHEDIIPLSELYDACAVARKACDEFPVGRVIARPYRGTPGAFNRTGNRRDFAMQPPEDTVLDILANHGVFTMTIGKLDDIFAHRGISKSVHVENNQDAQHALIELLDRHDDGFIFVNFIDFDMLYGHRRDPKGYATCLEETDAFMTSLFNRLDPEDLLVVTADHGNDPTFSGTDHTREFVPLLAWHERCLGKSLGVRHGFFDIAQSLASFFDIPPMPRGRSFLAA
jgi:phosphopentomutase